MVGYSRWVVRRIKFKIVKNFNYENLIDIKNFNKNDLTIKLQKKKIDKNDFDYRQISKPRRKSNKTQWLSKAFFFIVKISQTG